MVLGNAGRFLYDTPRGKAFVRSESKMIGLQAKRSVCGWTVPFIYSIKIRFNPHGSMGLVYLLTVHSNFP